MEIEKKYKVKYLPKNLEQYEKKEIEQGYLCTNPVVRIRKSNEDYILTYKSRYGIEEKEDRTAVVSNEVEVMLQEEGYYHLREKIDGNLIEKSRYHIPLEHNLIAELDIFHGKLQGMVIVEVEFLTEDDAKRFIPPEWFGEDVSLEKEYTNKYLAFLGK